MDGVLNRNMIHKKNHSTLSTSGSKSDHRNHLCLKIDPTARAVAGGEKEAAAASAGVVGSVSRASPTQHRHHQILLHTKKILIKNSQEINEQKNEILSRPCRFGRPLGVCKLYLFCCLMLLIAVGAKCAPSGNVLTSLSAGLGTRTLGYPKEEAGSRIDRRHVKKQKFINKNCKEFDVTSRAYLADLIFEGTARSRSSSSFSGRYDVTFVIQKILKQQAGNLKAKSQLRLHFNAKLSRNPYQDCSLSDILETHTVNANIRPGGKYYIFADRLGPMNYTAKGEPIVNNRRNLKSIRSVLSRIKEKPPRIRGVQNMTRRLGDTLNLSCQVKGRPVPRITWFKDAHLIIPSPHLNVTYYRRNSTIEIKSLEIQDGGRYECRATNIFGKIAAASSYVNITQYYTENTTTSSTTPTTTTDSDWPMHAEKCQVDAFCLNNGKCRFISSIGEHMCICEVGYKGARCENKDVSTRDWYPSNLDSDMALPNLKRLYRRRTRGHTPRRTNTQLTDFHSSLREPRKFRHNAKLNGNQDLQDNYKTSEKENQ